MGPARCLPIPRGSPKNLVPLPVPEAGFGRFWLSVAQSKIDTSGSRGPPSPPLQGWGLPPGWVGDPPPPPSSNSPRGGGWQPGSPTGAYHRVRCTGCLQDVLGPDQAPIATGSDRCRPTGHRSTGAMGAGPRRRPAPLPGRGAAAEVCGRGRGAERRHAQGVAVWGREEGGPAKPPPFAGCRWEVGRLVGAPACCTDYMVYMEQFQRVLCAVNMPLPPALTGVFMVLWSRVGQTHQSIDQPVPFPGLCLN